MNEVDISPLMVGIILTTYGILSIPFKDTFGKFLKWGYFNAFSQKHSETLILIFAPIYILAGLFLILFSFRHLIIR